MNSADHRLWALNISNSNPMMHAQFRFLFKFINWHSNDSYPNTIASSNRLTSSFQLNYNDQIVILIEWQSKRWKNEHDNQFKRLNATINQFSIRWRWIYDIFFLLLINYYSPIVCHFSKRQWNWDAQCSEKPIAIVNACPLPCKIQLKYSIQCQWSIQNVTNRN